MEVGMKMGTSILQRDDEKKEITTINFEETELSLGLGLALPGNNSSSSSNSNGEGSSIRKRGFSETESAVDLKLNLSNSNSSTSCKLESAETAEQKAMDMPKKETKVLLPCAAADPVKPPAKAQVVGWPPVRSFRKNMMAVQKSSKDEESATAAAGGAVAFVKVSMDGAPYLRKVDLKMYSSYQQLSEALASMFSSFTIGSCGSQGGGIMNERKLKDLLNGSDYVPTYEDKDGDWMLVGDVPWEMFVESCKRLRIMKGTEAIGLAPRAMEKRKNRS